MINSIFLTQINHTFSQQDYIDFLLLLITILLLLMCSAAVSASESAFFGLNKLDIKNIQKKDPKVGREIASILEKPKKLLATILIVNNAVNIAMVILSSVLINKFEKIFGGPEYLYLIIQVVVITSLILLFGEITPKIYANKRGYKTVIFMAKPIKFLMFVFSWFSGALVGMSSLFDALFKEDKKHISVDELSNVHDMVEGFHGNEQEQKMLDGILEFGNTEVKSVMKSRTEFTAIEIKMDFNEVKKIILNNGYSRIPVYDSSLDRIKGVLFIKDLIPFIGQTAEFDWQEKLRPAFFVPENKKLDDLLIEFQEKKTHLAVVVDEYGGTSGIITMADIIEEIVGEIRDEFDDDDLEYSKLDENKYVFDGKIQLKDFYRIIDMDGYEFEDKKGDADTIAGFILEQTGGFPRKGDVIRFLNYSFTIESVDKKRIRRIRFEIEIINDETNV